MTYSDDERDGDAAEFVLGTLMGEDRDAFERALATDADLQARVSAWENLLGGMIVAVRPVDPAPEVWSRINRDIPAARPALSEPGVRGGETPPLAAMVERLRRSLMRWRLVTAGALAAMLVALLFAFQPEPPLSAVLVAVLQPSGTGPAWLVRSEPGDRASILPINAPQAPANRDFELWAIPGAGAAPISVGILRGAGPNVVRLPEPVMTRLGSGVTLAVSVEPPGGSTTGAPTGPVVYSGSLAVLPQNR